MSRAAILAIGTPVALDTKGTVREARGLTSSTYTLPIPSGVWRRVSDPHGRGEAPSPHDARGIANCTFIRPITLSARASLKVYSRMRVSSVWGISTVGSTQEESPE